MPEILSNMICLTGAAYLIFYMSRKAVSIVKMFTNKNKSESKDILHEQG